MNYRKVNDKIFVSLQTGDLINESMRQIAVEENISNAWINGIGAIDNVEVGYMDVKNKKYQKRNFDEHYELLSLIGNIINKYFIKDPYFLNIRPVYTPVGNRKSFITPVSQRIPTVFPSEQVKTC